MGSGLRYWSPSGEMAIDLKTFTSQDWSLLLTGVREQECLVFLGAGASTVPDGKVGLPTGGMLSEKLAIECEYPGADKRDFLRVCQYYELVQDGHRLRKSIVRHLSIPGVVPGKLHELIAGLPIKYVLTTNYDWLMERAFQTAGKQPQVVVYDINSRPAANNIDVSERRPLVYKLHGTMDDYASMLCTEDDIVQFLACVIQGEPPLLTGIKQLFEDHTILFVGYGLKDWNIRTIIRAMRGTQRKDFVRSFALNRAFDRTGPAAADWDQSVMYWNRKENVHLIDVDATDFFEDLARRLKQP